MITIGAHIPFFIVRVTIKKEVGSAISGLVHIYSSCMLRHLANIFIFENCCYECSWYAVLSVHIITFATSKCLFIML